MRVMPRSIAERMVWTDSSTSVPPHIQPPMAHVPRAMREAGQGTGRLQTGLVRTYALSIAASLAIVTVVFVAVR